MDPAAAARVEERARIVIAARAAGVRDSRVLNALEGIDRRLFLKGHFAARAYEDTPLPIPCGQTISQPSVVALMSEALEIAPGHTVLEVGTGSGYQAAILSRLARRVYTVDRFPTLVREAQGAFGALKLANVVAMVGDGTRGLPMQAPFDRILVTAAAEDPPSPLLAQLREGGVMIVPVGRDDAVQTLVKVRRTSAGFDYEELRPVRFVPLLEGLGHD
ncbi:protein-L-isoaspartate(D-aspartate) O-methyltransferase [Hasllibacter halocynthiae]|uniref:Protein-L-isoaspartate O-methyltransferase n=1 Tax=Hasllibacter halocynthiae TaxID=595589 RepID=A0A2T0X802_9RHOB|nr:protein-L-isoaspartate(D-aspartate) O-methyltransferase [Hasllibacter halocynthiae]PRY95081.1 protein-L-isoaspartate(D-aspartate) O-methyltransferase [Hasllibacter halocynthiae]